MLNKLIVLSVMVALAFAQTNSTNSTNTTNTTASTVNSSGCYNDKYCASCSGTNSCRVCVNSFVGSNGICQEPVNKINNCYSYLNSSTCGVCNSGYFLSSNNTCVNININHCIEVNPNAQTLCITCDNGNLPINGSCNSGPTCGVDNCSVCKYANNSTGGSATNSTSNSTNSTATNTTSTATSSYAICVICKSGYSVTASGTCVKEPTKHCLATGVTTNTTSSTNTTATNNTSSSSSATSCRLCSRGYYDNNNSCKSTSVQGSGVGIFAALISFIAVLAFL